MSVPYIIVFVILMLYTVQMGLQDGANSIATPIATNSVRRFEALFIAISFNLIAPIIAYYSNNFAVANTISRDMIKTSIITQHSGKIGYIFVISGILSALLWMIISSLIKLPSSSSHALLGGVIGAAVPFFGIRAIQWNNVFLKVILVAVATPFIGLVIGFLLMQFFKLIVSRLKSRVNVFFLLMQRINIAILSSSIAINDIQKSMGVMFLLMLVSPEKMKFDFSSSYFVFILAICFTIGLLIGGNKLVYTIGNRIYKLTTFDSFVAQTTSQLIVFTSSTVGLPVSTGQIMSSSIMGIGMASRISSVKWNVSRRMFINWLVTLPFTFVFGMMVSALLKLLI